MTEFALKGLRIIDHTIAWAGPQGTLLLADMGAEVIKVESCTHPDVMRGGGSVFGRGNPKFWEMGPWFLQLNRNKLDITIDLSKPEGKALYLKLVTISDAIIDNFTPRVMSNLGLSYEELKKVKSDIVVVHLPGYGSTGSYKDAPAYGDCINAFSGLDNITGYPDKPNMRPGIAYGDPTSGFAAAFGLLSALHYRQRTGKGQVIDVSHFEATSKAMVGLLDYAINRRIQQPMGNKDARFAPQGCYPCKGDDKWVVITIASERDWLEFIKILNNPEWAYDSRFATSANRKEYHEELDKLIGAWTCQHNNYEIMRLLQEVRIAAAPVLESGELIKDPHFEARGFYETSIHAYTGTKLLPGTAYKMSRTAGGTRWSAPLFGEHNDYIFKDLLRLSDAEIAELTQKGVIGTEPSYARG
jgi:crotonobetainyl-CoA:carnitine CoA-transferase CaiB-like acyl-CoA transferase